MGDRAYVYVHDGERPGVYLYSHWGGYELPDVVISALKRGQRWRDDSYLARIIFSEMIKDDVAGETGFGISATEPDSEGGRHIHVNTADQTVTFNGYHNPGPHAFPAKEWSDE